MELRAYHFQNMYLHGIHAGIQTQHCTAEMFVKYRQQFNCGCSTRTCKCPAPNDYLYEWAENHKTTIVLNGGYQSNLIEVYELMCSPSNPYPWGCFYESQAALNGCLTNVGIILPKKVFSYVEKQTRKGNCGFGDYDVVDKITDWEKLMAKEIVKCKLMT